MGKRMRLAGVVATVCFLLLVIFPVAAQDGWMVWLYNPPDGTMLKIGENGAVLDQLTLPLPQGFDRYPSRIAVGRNGTPFAYVVFNETTFQGALVVAERDQVLASFNLPVTIADSTEFIADASIFNDDNSAVALGYSLEGGGWALLVLDIPTKAVSATLRYDAPLVSALGVPGGVGLTPVVRRFSRRTVSFNLVQSGTEGAASYDSYDWNLDTGALTLNPVFPSLDSDTFAANGEMIMSLPDDRLPNDSNAFAFFQSNTLQVFDPFSGARFPVYNAPEQTLYSPHFIQNGEAILVGVSNANRTGWRVLSRDGNVIGDMPDVTINDVRGVYDGFIYSTNTFSPGTTSLVLVNTRDGLDAGAPVWTSPPGGQQIIAWIGDFTLSTQLAYPAWPQLAPPVYAPGSIPATAAAGSQTVATPGPVSPSQITSATQVVSAALTAGRLALVNTTEGDQLNVRLGPGRAFDVVAQVSAGERVLLLEGPRSADGLNWWKIRLNTGVEGWVVESVDDNGTRLQTLMPG